MKLTCHLICELILLKKYYFLQQIHLHLTFINFKKINLSWSVNQSTVIFISVLIRNVYMICLSFKDI